MTATVEQAVFLTPAGAKALAHLQPWLHGQILRCRDVEMHAQGCFLVVVAVPQALPFEEALGDVKLWIPLQHVDLVVLDNAVTQIGFMQDKPVT